MHIKRTVLQEYKQKLNIQGQIISDPSNLKSGWINKKKMNQKMVKIIFFCDVYIFICSRFYIFVLGKDNLVHRLECEYKQKNI